MASVHKSYADIAKNSIKQQVSSTVAAPVDVLTKHESSKLLEKEIIKFIEYNEKLLATMQKRHAECEQYMDEEQYDEMLEYDLIEYHSNLQKISQTVLGLMARYEKIKKQITIPHYRDLKAQLLTSLEN